MPQIVIKGMETKHVQTISKDMIEELQAIIQCPREYFIIECANPIFIMDGNIVSNIPFIEVKWFDRGQEVQDKSAEAITKHVNGVGYNNVDIAFLTFEKNNYYENGSHF